MDTLQIAKKILDVWGFDIESIQSILDDLENHNTTRSKDVAKKIKSLIEESGRCPECLKDDWQVKEYRYKDSPNEYESRCRNCGYSY